MKPDGAKVRSGSYAQTGDFFAGLDLREYVNFT